MPDAEISVSLEGDSDMALEKFEAIMEQAMGEMGQIASMYMGDLKTISKAQDYSFQQDKGLISLSEAVGTREVSSRVNPSGPVPATAKDG